jgi:hypothetical protein
LRPQNPVHLAKHAVGPDFRDGALKRLFANQTSFLTNWMKPLR